MEFYLYRFLNSSKDIIYIGRTNDIKRRILKEHFTDNTHLPNICYLETQKVEYVKVVNESEEVAYEAILINEYRPKYNTQFKDEGEFDIQMPDFDWVEFEWEYVGQFEWLKKRKENVVEVNEVAVNYLMQPEVQGITTGIINLDSRVLISQQSFTLIAGESGSGKTTYALNIANRNAKQKKKVLYVNLKDSIEDLSMKILSMDSQIPIKKLLLKQIKEQEYEKCIDSLKNRQDTELLFYNTNDNNWNLEKILLEIRKGNVDLVIIDDLQMIEHERNNYVKDRMEFILKSIKATAVQLFTPIIGTCCISKKIISARLDHRPMIMDFEYDSLLKYSDNIQLLYRDELYNKDTEYKNISEIIVTKNILGELFTTQVCCINGVFANIKDIV